MIEHYINIISDVGLGKRDDVLFSTRDDRRVHFISSHGCRSRTQEQFEAMQKRTLDHLCSAIMDLGQDEDQERLERARKFLRPLFESILPEIGESKR